MAFRCLLFLAFEYLHQLEHFVAVLCSLNEFHLLGGVLHQFAGALNALFQLLDAHVFHNRVTCDCCCSVVVVIELDTLSALLVLLVKCKRVADLFFDLCRGYAMLAGGLHL